jgi:hypothetical protein
MYSEHYAEALRALRRFGDRSKVTEFIAQIEPEPMQVRDCVVTAQTLLFLGMTAEAGAHINNARSLAAERGTTLESEMAELSRSHQAQVELLSTIEASPTGASAPRQNLTLSQWRAFERRLPQSIPPEEMEERWTAVLREPEAATMTELRLATTYWAKRLASGESLTAEVASEREQMVVRGYSELMKVNPRSARIALDGSPELKALLDRVQVAVTPGG